MSRLIRRSWCLSISAFLLVATAKAQSSSYLPRMSSRGKAIAAPHAPAVTVLYDQNDNDASSGSNSQDFEAAFDPFDDEGADDFVVPTGVNWAITSVSVTGVYFNGSGPAPAVNLTIFNDNAGVPDTVACGYPLQTPADSAGSFVFTLPTNCVLPSGTYWLDVQVRMDFMAGGEWAWETRSVQSNALALWRNPNDGFATGCTDWTTMQSCISGTPGPDFMFALTGQEIVATPTSLLVDQSGAGNLNGVFELGETATIAPSWMNGTTADFTLQGLVSDFSGDPGPTYVVDDGTADYGAIAVGATANCGTATGDCIAVHITGSRPTQHFDASLTEQPTPGLLAPDAGLPPEVWVLHVGESFDDVTTATQFYSFIETIFHNEITGGCGGTNYCPTNTVTRAQMAAFLLKAKNGSSYLPPACTGMVFTDVPCTGGLFDPWIENLAGQGITGGCGGTLYCPGNPVTRAQMAAFLLKTLHGAPYVPPNCTGMVFTDVPCTGGLFDPWIENLAADSITGGCGGTLYCPDNPNTRGQMAVFLTKTFSLVLYGP